MTTLYDDVGELFTNDPQLGDESPLGILRDAAMIVDGEHIAWVGRRADAPAADRRADCQGSSVIPGFVDRHAHLLFAGDRAAEFAARTSGQPYDCGGIAVTVAATSSSVPEQRRSRPRAATD